jgi:uncharacterized protein (DUF1501 family)
MLNRRQFLSLSAAASLGSSLSLSPLMAMGDDYKDKRFVFVILRGGMDAVSAVAPYAEQNYYDSRPKLAVPRPGDRGGLIDLDGYFGFHPALAKLKPYYDNKELAVVHAVASSYRGRSHFDAQDVLENGTEKINGAKDGWLNRLVGTMAANGRDASKIGLAIGDQVPLAFQGGVNVASWHPLMNQSAQLDAFISKVLPLYKDHPVLGKSLQDGKYIKTMAMAAMGDGPSYLEDQLDTSPTDDMMMGDDARMDGKLPPRHRATLSPANMKVVGALLSKENGPRVAMFESGGWDTHARQGVVLGALGNRLGTLAEMLDILAQSMQSVWDDTVVLVTTEFGRQVQENGSQGTDHGTGSLALVMGGAVNGGKIYGDWPTIAEDSLFEKRDLMPTTDLRAVQKAVLHGHLGVPLTDINHTILPGSGGVKMMYGLVRS